MEELNVVSDTGHPLSLSGSLPSKESKEKKKKKKKKEKERKKENYVVRTFSLVRFHTYLQYRFDITGKSFTYSLGFAVLRNTIVILIAGTLRFVPTFREYTSSLLRGRPETVSVTANCPKEALNYLELITKRRNKGQRVVNPLSANLFSLTSSVCWAV